MPTRRAFLAATTAALLAPRLARAQLRLVIGFLWTQTAEASVQLWDGYTGGGLAAGISNGRDYTAQHVWADGDDAKLAGYAEYLVNYLQRPVMMVAQSSRGALAAAAATKTMPIIAPTLSDAALPALVGPDPAHPNANVTGIVVVTAAMLARQLELARELVPSDRRVGYLNGFATAGTEIVRSAAVAANAQGVELVRADNANPEDPSAAFAQLRAEGVRVIIVPSPELAELERRQIIVLAKTAKIPVIFGNQPAAGANIGGLIGYGGDPQANYRRAGAMAAAILRGAKPEAIPVEMPAPVLIVNMKTAREQGITVPASILSRADQVVQ